MNELTCGIFYGPNVDRPWGRWQTGRDKASNRSDGMQKILFEPGTPIFIYRLFQFSTVGLLVLLAALYSQGKARRRTLSLLTSCDTV